MTQEDHILVAILDWGLGHATRSSVLIDQFLSEGKKLTIASSGKALEWLKHRYPTINVIEKPGVEISYSEHRMNWKLVSQAPGFLLSIRKEKKWTRKIVDQRKITKIYSDNCYGVFHSDIESIFITHQLDFDLAPVAKSSAKKLIETLIAPFDEIHIPDLKGGVLSGMLSKTSLTNVKYIGPLSRFSTLNKTGASYKWVAVISGPEPNRSNLLRGLLDLFEADGGNNIIFSGDSNGTSFMNGNTKVIPRPTDQEMKSAMIKSEVIFCRSGYSSLMDLHSLERKALLIPTKSQPEQEYLSNHFELSFGFSQMDESELNLEVVQKLLQDNPSNFGSFVL